MSSTLQPAVDKPDAGGHAPTLAGLRAELDRLDDAMHDLLMRRAEVVTQVGALGVKGPVPLRPGREAAIIRRLLARHRGPFPPASLVWLWRELICGMTALQRPLRIAVGGGEARVAVAREHFGALVAGAPGADDTADVLRELRGGVAVAAVLPMPHQDEARPWWPALLDRGGAAHPCGRPAAVLGAAAGRARRVSRRSSPASRRPTRAGPTDRCSAWRSAGSRSRGAWRAALQQAGFEPRSVAITRGAQVLVDVAGLRGRGRRAAARRCRVRWCWAPTPCRSGRAP